MLSCFVARCHLAYSCAQLTMCTCGHAVTPGSALHNHEEPAETDALSTCLQPTGGEECCWCVSAVEWSSMQCVHLAKAEQQQAVSTACNNCTVDEKATSIAW